MTTYLYEFVYPFPLYVNVENAKNPARKHFKKTSSKHTVLNDYGQSVFQVYDV